MHRVAITGMACLTPIGSDWQSIAQRLRSGASGVRNMPEWDDFEGLGTRLGAPVEDFSKPDHYSRRATRSMSRVALLATRATELALTEAQLLGDPWLGSGEVGVAYGSSTGSVDAIHDFGRMLANRSTAGITANTYLKMMAHTTAANISQFFGLRGRVLTTSSACTSGSQGIGYAYEAIRSGRQVAMVAGGADELSPAEAAVFDTLYATSQRNAAPHTTPRPFDRDRDGLVVGEGAASLVLEDLDHARARGARVLAEVVGFGTNADGAHLTRPDPALMAGAMQLALADQQVAAAAVGYLSAHGTATQHGDAAEAQATAQVFGGAVPISALKSYTGHTLGACGAMEVVVSLRMLADGWVHDTLNLDNVDPACAGLDHVRGGPRALDCEFAMSNNFAFGGVNTALLLRRLG